VFPFDAARRTGAGESAKKRKAARCLFRVLGLEMLVYGVEKKRSIGDSFCLINIGYQRSMLSVRQCGSKGTKIAHPAQYTCVGNRCTFKSIAKGLRAAD
jgi:hypothetical protein